MDVARRGGVSRTTASFVLSGRRDMRISADAERRVRQAARELNYRPNLLARSLRTNFSQTIGLLSDVIASEAFAGEIIQGSMTTALRHDHLLFVGETQGDHEVQRQLVQAMVDRGVGGFVYASMYTRAVRVSKILRDHRLVLLNALARGKPVPTVVPDEVEAGRAAATELLRHGHLDRIALVGEQPRHIVAATERVAGIQEVLGRHGAQLAAIVETLWWPEPAQRSVAEYLASGTKPSAVICMNDRIAMGTYQAAAAAGLRIPHDLSIVSFDNSDLASWLRPGLTSIAIPHFEMGRRAVELLLEPVPDAVVHRIPMSLQSRDSVGEPNRRPGTLRGRVSR